MSRKALGRGLNALLGDARPSDEPADRPVDGFAQIPVDLIDPNPFQPRRVISEQQLKELADSIQATGVVQPVLVRRIGERFQLVAGERRWRAALLVKLQTVPAVVRDLPDREALEIAIAENVLREDLSAIEVARAFQSLHEKFSYSHEDIATRLGMDRSTVTNTLRLLKLPIVLHQLIEDKSLTSGHARALLGCATPELQIQLAQRVIKEGLSVREVERLVVLPAAPGRPPQTSDREEPAAPKQDPNLKAAVLEMERTLGTKVKVVGNENSGRIEISYYSAQDLNRLYDWIARK